MRKVVRNARRGRKNKNRLLRAEAYLIESDVSGVLAETTTADLQAIFTDDALSSSANAATTGILAISSWVRSLLFLQHL